MGSNNRYSALVISLAVSSVLAGCISTTREIDTVPATPLVQAPAPVVVASPPSVVQVPAPVVVAGPATTTTSTSWGNGAIQQRKTTTSVDGTAVQRQTTTTWNNGDSPSQTTTTTTTNPY